MTKLTVIILLTISVYSNENLKLPKKICIQQLEKIIKNGWDESNQTLNSFIIKSAKQAIPRILKQLHQPLSIKDGSNIIDEHYFPKLILTREDYIQLFSYVKYLNYQGKQEEAYAIYINALKGLRHTKSKAMMNMLFRMVNEKTIITSLKESLTNNTFSNNTKIKLKKELKNLLVLDKSLLLETIRYEYMITNKIFKNTLLKDINNQEEKKLMSKVLFYSKKYINEYHKKLEKSIVLNSLDIVENSRTKEIEKFKSFNTKINLAWNYTKIKLAIFFSLNHDYTELAKVLAQANFLVATPSINSIYQNYINQVQNNQNFLKSL